MKTVSQRSLMRMCRMVVARALESYTDELNKIIDPLAGNLEAIEELLLSEGNDGQGKQGV